MKIAEARKGLLVEISKFHYLEFKRILFARGVTPQEFFGFIAKLVVQGDNRLYSLIEESINDRTKDGEYNFEHTDEQSIYNFIKQKNSERKKVRTT